MNKQQISYLSNKMDTSVRQALDDLSRAHRDKVEGALAEQLVRAGFKVNISKYSSIMSLVYTDELKDLKTKLDAEYNDVAKYLRDKRNVVMDTLILGDSQAALAILEQFNADLKAFIK